MLSTPNHPNLPDPPAAEFQAIARSVELIGYARIFPWSCLVVMLGSGLPTLLFDPAGSLYSENIVLANRATAILAMLFGLYGTWRLKNDRQQVSQQPELWLGAVVLGCVAFNNALLLIETEETRHVGAAILSMLCAAFIYPRLLGLLIITVPHLCVVMWLATQSQWSENWLFGFSATFGGVCVAFLSHFGARIYSRRYQALLAERTSMLDALKSDSIAHAVSQERALNERHLSTLGRLAGGIAHDLNNILVPILGNAAMLEESVETSDHKRQAKEVMLAAGRARSLSQQLSYFSTRHNAEPETLELNRTLNELTPIVWRALPQGIDIKVKDAPQPVYLELNRMTLQDLITNLLLDAGNATLPGGSVNMKAFPSAELPGEFSAIPGRNYCAIAIRDGGETLSIEKQTSILNADQLDTSERGLGLRSARATAVSLGGGLTVQTAPSGGNQFCLFLPIRTEPQKVRGTPDARIISAVASEILVVDDEPAVRSVTVQLLQRAGFIVRDCDSGETALTEIARHLPDAIVMDLRMPGIGGRAATEAIRNRYSQLPILVCTGFAGDAQGWLSDLPNCALVQKPYETEDLISKVNQLLHRELAED